MKTIQIPGQKHLQKYVPQTKGIVQPAITGSGFGRLARGLDKIALKGFVDSIGLKIPILNLRVSLIDAGNFVIHNKGLKFDKKEGYIAVGADRALELGLNFDKIKIPNSFDDLVRSGEL